MVYFFQVHWPVFLSDFKECFDELNRQKAKGRIREYGICNFGKQNLVDALEVGAKPITNQVNVIINCPFATWYIVPNFTI